MKSWPNAIANIVLSLTALIIIGGFVYFHCYYIAGGLIAAGIFVYVILQFANTAHESQKILAFQLQQQADFYRNWLNYLMDSYSKRIDPVTAHAVNNVPPVVQQEPEEMIMNFDGLDNVKVKKVRGE